MDEEALNTSVRKFLKKLGVTAQREIEIAVRDADAKDLLRGGDPAGEGGCHGWRH
jgi:hypothetical protein